MHRAAPNPFVNPIRYLILNHAIPLNGYILENHQIIVSYLIQNMRLHRYLFLEIMVLEERLYTEQYWYNNRDYIRQSIEGIYQWILLHI